MKHFFYLILLIFITSCSNQKEIQLPEITNSEITEVLDISPAYIFYDTSKPDSLELNRKNLISTTNWLVNVDKRLTLQQVIPQIAFLQNKKKNSSHKKEGVKNYFTCNYTSIKNLGFLEFTDVVYKTEKNSFNNEIRFNQDDIQFNNKHFKNLKNLFEQIKEDSVSLSFDERLSFQKYIQIKSQLKEVNNRLITINITEFIY